jgi:hypothetical protein
MRSLSSKPAAWAGLSAPIDAINGSIGAMPMLPTSFLLPDASVSGNASGVIVKSRIIPLR